MNAPRTPWCHADIVAMASLAAAPVPLRVQALIETAAGVARLHEIAGASARLDSLILGYADLSASLGRAAGARAELDSWRAIQDAVLVAARAHDVAAIDGPYLGIKVDEGFTAAAERARDMGFDGKWAIHPAQVAALNELFSPSDEEVAHARAVIEALEDAERSGGAGAVALDGQMLDEAVRVAALRVLARAGAAA